VLCGRARRRGGRRGGGRGGGERRARVESLGATAGVLAVLAALAA
jgi:hypothetical protein